MVPSKEGTPSERRSVSLASLTSDYTAGTVPALCNELSNTCEVRKRNGFAFLV